MVVRLNVFLTMTIKLNDNIGVGEDYEMAMERKFSWFLLTAQVVNYKIITM